MRSILGLFHDMSILDPKTGISIRGYSLQEMCEFLPKAQDSGSIEGEGDEPLPEGLIWFLMTGEFPTPE